MFDTRPGARVAMLALVVALLAVLAPRAVRWLDDPARKHSAAVRDRSIDREPLPPPGSPATVRDPIDVYRGLGTWIDVYDSAWRDPEASVRRMAAEGIRTLYLQTSNFSRTGPFVYRDKVGRFLDAAHRRGIRVVAWYLPGFEDVVLDVHRTLAAVTYRSRDGNTFDSYAVDIESPAVSRSFTRTRRLLAYSRRLRGAVGPDYPLGAIVPSPVSLAMPTTYWPAFPFRSLARAYDVFLPMTYFTYRVSGEDGAHWYTAQNIEIIRRLTGDPTVPIHVIGGIGPSPSETRGFVDAVRERGVIGASYYTFPITPDDDWQPLRQVAPIPDQARALPVAIPSETTLGNVPGSDTSHPKEVVYRVDGRRGRYRVAYEGFDVGSNEVSLLVNWERVGTLPPGTAGAWSGQRSVAVPERYLDRRDPNYIAFVAEPKGRGDWPTWGVRDVHLARPRAS